MKTETLNLNASHGATTAHVARPDNDTVGAVILIQEYWGINDHIRDIAGRYAKEGYLCLAPDLYRGEVAKNTEEASKLMQRLAIEDGLETIRETIAEAKRIYNVQKIGITGYCMGGTFAMSAACEISEFAWINPEKVNQLIEAARKYDLPVEVVTYDADHAFFNDTRSEVYNPQAAADAWRRVLDLFSKHLATAVPTGA